MPYTPAQITDFAYQGALKALESQPGRDALAGAELWWLDHVLNGTTTPGMDAAQVALIDDMHKALVALNSISKPAPAPAAVSPAL
jgi:hypothetical protein